MNIHEMIEIRLDKFLVSIHKILPDILKLPKGMSFDLYLLSEIVTSKFFKVNE